MGSKETHYSAAQSGRDSGQFHSAGGTARTASGAPAATGGGSEQSVSLAPPAWAARRFGSTAAGEEDDLPQRGSTASELYDDGMESLRQSGSSVLVRPAAPPALTTDTSGAPLSQAFNVAVAAAARQPNAPPSPLLPSGRASTVRAGAAAPTSSAQQQLTWEFPRMGQGSPQRPAGPPAAAAAAASPQRFQPPPAQPLQWGSPAMQHVHMVHTAAPDQQPQPQHPPAPIPQPATQQPLPPGRYGWQRNMSLSGEADVLPPPPQFAAAASASASMAPTLAPSAPCLSAANSWQSSMAGGESQPEGLPRPPPPFRPPDAASAVMHRGASLQQQLSPAEAALYASGDAEAGAAPGLHTATASFTKSMGSAAFHMEAYAGAASSAAEGTGGGAAAAGGGLKGQRPSRTAALRRRHAAQLRRQDRDQYGVPVADSARPFSLWASPQVIGESCTGLGVYFASLKQFIIAALLLSLVAIYPLTSNMTSQRWADSYTLVSDAGPLLQCGKGWDTGSWVTGTSAGSRCSSSRYSSSFDCPSICTWSAAQLKGQCAGLPPLVQPYNARLGGNATCLLHPPCTSARSSNLTAPDGPCYCCDLQLDPTGSSTGSTADTVPPAQLWVLFIGQLTFLVWVLLLTRAQLHAVHAADARVITASDYAVRLQGVPRGLSRAELQEWCSHYGSVVSAFHIPDVGHTLRVAKRLHTLHVRRAESDAWLASASCGLAACWFNAWALGATTRRRLLAAEEDAARMLRCFERQELRPTGAALVVYEYAEHAANCIEDHHRSGMRRAVDAVLCGSTASAPRLASTRVKVDRAPEPSDVLWEHTACAGSAALGRRLGTSALTLLIVALGAGVQYGLSVAGEQERKNRLSHLYDFDPSTDYSLNFSSWAAFTASALEVTKLNAISMLSGLAVVTVNWLVTVAVRQLAMMERWHTRTAGERWALLKLSVAYLTNSFVVPLLAAYFANSSNSWYSRGGLMESAFYMQLASALLPPLAVLCDLEEFFYYCLLSRSAKTQAMTDRLLQPPPFLLAEQYASALTTLGVALCWMPVLPISPLIAVLGLFFAYWTDKIVALRRCAHPGNMRGKLVSSSALLVRLLPLVQLLLMRFVYFKGEGAMSAVFWAGLAVWLLFAVAPLRTFLGLVPRRRSTVTGGMSYQETLGRGQRKGMDDHYEAQLPPCCSSAFRRQVAAALTPLPAPLPACEALLPRQEPATGGAATRPPFRPDKSADHIVARAAASLRARQQAVLSSTAGMSVGISRAGSGLDGAGAGAGAAPAAAMFAGPVPPLALPLQQAPQHVPLPQQQVPPMEMPPAGAGAQHLRHQRQQSGASGGGGTSSRLAHTLSAVRDTLSSGATWLWNTPDPDNVFAYDWRQALEDDNQTSASAPPLPPPFQHSTGSGPGMA